MICRKRIACDELVTVTVVFELHRPVGEIEKCLEVVFLAIVEVAERYLTLRSFGQEAALDYFRYICRVQGHAVAETGLNFGEVVLLLLGHVTDHRGHFLLSGDDDPGLPFAFCVQAFCNSLQVSHELYVVRNVLADFVYEEV